MRTPDHADQTSWGEHFSVEALVDSISVSCTPKNDVAVLACYEKEHGVATSRRVLACYEKAWLGVGGVLACYEKERGNACPEECSHVTKKRRSCAP